MNKSVLKVFLQAVFIALASGFVAIGTNALRSDAIPLIADVEYDIFALCKDSETESQEANANTLNDKNDLNVLYVDARPR